ncbi:MAG: MBOAT family O-acyltransferase [Thermoanaerobacterales bacterium]|nr:MBOAT family O-acyltransferase [Thermoanaerobacterales bacterium]
MIFTTGIFAVFLALALAAYWLVPRRWAKYVLILAGFVFYTYYFPLYFLLIAAMTVLTYAAGLMIFRTREGGGRLPGTRWWFVAGILLSVLTLGYFKYWKMAVATVNALADRLDWGVAIPAPQILVPLGISFFTFEFIHYLTDVYLGKIRRETVNPVDFTLFAFFFPTLVCGPIKRYQAFQEQLARPVRFDPGGFLAGGRRVVWGMFQKLVIADTVTLLTGPLTAPETSSTALVVVAVYAYAAKIYFDFSGYSDIAIGISRMFGLAVPENFAAPYRSASIAEFWRRWHMSLSSWIRDYLFIPLGGSRVPLWRTVFNLGAVFAVCGLWHGAAWNFVVWGLWHGVGMGVHRVWRTFTKGRLPWAEGRTAHAVSVLVTFHFVALGWVLFAAPLDKAVLVFKKLALALLTQGF